MPISLPLWPFALMTLWDFYYDGVRPFDHLATLILTGYWVLQSGRCLRIQGALLALPLVIWAVIVTLAGGLQFAEAAKPGIGLLEGAILAFVVMSSRIERNNLAKMASVLIMVHAGALLFQFTFFHLTGHLINFLAIAGQPLRFNLIITRPTGLFLEPADFALTMCMLLVLFRVAGGRSWWLETLGLTTMMLTLSLWGWGASALYVLLFRPLWLSFLVPIAISIMGIIMAAATGPLAAIGTRIVHRVMDLGSDASAAQRYGGLSSLLDLTSPSLWFGTGVTQNYEAFGQNGLAFIITASGLVGLILFILYWIWLMPTHARLRGAIFMVFMLSAASLWTYAWWWAFMALIAQAAARQSIVQHRSPLISAPVHN